MPGDHQGQVGRPRDETLDREIVEAATALIMEQGLDAVTFARVAERAGTTRPAVYRRYGDPGELVLAGVERIAAAERPEPTGDPATDLIAELRSFQRAIGRAGSLPLVGSVLVGAHDASTIERYRELIVRPRRARLRSILEAARSAGALTCSDGDIELATTMCTGSYYATALAGERPTDDWPERTAALVWRACGGSSTADRPTPGT